jgi:hypothetical protein
MDSSIGAMPKIKIPMMAIISKIIELLTLTEKRPIDQDLHINQDLHTNQDLHMDGKKAPYRETVPLL